MKICSLLFLPALQQLYFVDETLVVELLHGLVVVLHWCNVVLLHVRNSQFKAYVLVVFDLETE